MELLKTRFFSVERVELSFFFSFSSFLYILYMALCRSHLKYFFLTASCLRLSVLTALRTMSLKIKGILLELYKIMLSWRATRRDKSLFGFFFPEIKIKYADHFMYTKTNHKFKINFVFLTWMKANNNRKNCRGNTKGTT